MNPDNQEVTVDLRDMFRFLARGALLALFTAAVFGVGAYLLLSQQPPLFRADATLLVARTVGGQALFGMAGVAVPPIDLGAYRVAATSDAVLGEALQSMGVVAPEASDLLGLRAVVAATTETGVRDSSLLRIEARGPTVASAVSRSNAVAAAMVEWDRRRANENVRRVVASLELQIEALSEQIRTLQALADEADPTQIDGLIRLRAEQQQQLAYTRALVVSAEGLVSLLQPADTVVRQIAPRPVLFGAIGAIFGALLAYGLLLLRNALNTRLRSTDDIVAVTGLPVLTEFPAAGRNASARMREASSYLRTNLLFATEEAHPRVFMITSSVENEGKTTVARHLAEGFVRYGYRTLLVDADLRSPSIIRNYRVVGEVPAAASTESWLTDMSERHHVLSVRFGNEGHLDLIPQLEPVANASELLGRGFRRVLSRWQEYDVVVVDTPPLLLVADSLTIAPHCTGTVLVVDRQRSDRRKLAAALATLRRVGVHVLGVVANNEADAGSGAGYGAGYGEGPPLRRDRAAKVSAVARTGGADERG